MNRSKVLHAREVAARGAIRHATGALRAAPSAVEHPAMRILVIPAALAMTACNVPEPPGDASFDATVDARRADAADAWPDGVVCEGERLGDESIGCRRMGIPSGYLCIRYGCPGEDGGADLTGCCVITTS